MVGIAQFAAATSLDDYVHEPDSTYSYNLVTTLPGKGYTAYVVDMTSQTWRSPLELDRTRWQHWLIIVKPDTVKSNKALLFIDGGDNGGAPPSSIDEMLSAMAVNSQSVVADLKMIPNQPLVFTPETDTRYTTKGREEDAMIAYTWDKFLQTGDDRWPARLPMTKAAVRAMDTVQELCKTDQVGNLTIDGFVVAGGSKRGWTTWTTGAVDQRVIAIVPIVIDVLNVQVSMKHHYAAYGFWAPAIQDYVDMKVMDWMDTPEFSALMDIIDPYAYRDRYTMPKYLINSSGDQFFLPDSSQFYFDDLPGEKYLRYVPNSDHSLEGSDAPNSFLAYYQSILKGTPRPKFSWTLEGNDSIRVQTSDPPISVNLWQAYNPDARDFRLETVGPVWTSSELTDQGAGVYVGRVPKPAKGWTAFFVELVFDSGERNPFKFTTQVRVVPDYLPFAREIGAEGRGTSPIIWIVLLALVVCIVAIVPRLGRKRA
jgi:PhoPQ-activated pathogenicity-related protein